MHNVSQRIIQYNQGLLPDMVQIKYKLMTENMFRFYRGTCNIFYEDLSNAGILPPSPLAWLCGDLHLENFGSYKANNRLVHFDLNDFDEAILAPAAWEIVRIVTSIFIAFNSLGIDEKKAYKMAQLFLKTYSGILSGGKAYYIESKTAKGIVRTFLVNAGKRKKKELLAKRTEKKKKKLTIVMDDPRHFEIEKTLKRELCHHITDWILNSNDGPYNYEVRDVVFRLAGTGSVGLKRYAFLLESVNNPGKYLLVDMKQARPSALLPYVKTKQPNWDSEAERIVDIQQRMQNIPPALLSHCTFNETSYLIQEMQPVKDSINFKLIQDRYRDIYQVIDDMALLTASAQLRCSGRQGAATADELIAFGQNNQWQDVILNYAVKYTEKTAAYYKKFMADYKKGFD
jgi:uncharacterized protein (DUF2252 family)